MQNALTRGVVDGFFSSPHFPSLPTGHPFHIAICAVRLPPGCLPPAGGLGARIGSGTGASAEEAAFHAMAEAAERYALQFSDGRPARLFPVAWAGGEPEGAPIAGLTLGAPEGPPLTSRGGAAGASLADAATRAIHETLEHLALDRLRTGAIRPQGVALETLPDLAPHLAFLVGQARMLRVWVDAAPGYVAAFAVCCDADGGRLTLGSAAGSDAAHTVRRAAEEAMFVWRNMIEMERNAVPVTAATGEGSEVLRLYRGAAPRPAWLSAMAEENAPLPEPLPAQGPLIDCLARTAGRRARVFDMSVPGLDVPVARVLLG